MKKITRRKMNKRTFGSIVSHYLRLDHCVVYLFSLFLFLFVLVREVKSNWFGTSLVRRTRLRDSPRICLIIEFSHVTRGILLLFTSSLHHACFIIFSFYLRLFSYHFFFFVLKFVLKLQFHFILFHRNI